MTMDTRGSRSVENVGGALIDRRRASAAVNTRSCERLRVTSLRARWSNATLRASMRSAISRSNLHMDRGRLYRGMACAKTGAFDARLGRHPLVQAPRRARRARHGAA